MVNNNIFYQIQLQPLILIIFLQPFLVGKAVLPLKRILSGKSPCSSRYQLEVKTSTLADAVRERETSDRVIGSLEVCEATLKRLTPVFGFLLIIRIYYLG
jgi:hypothetical protein